MPREGVAAWAFPAAQTHWLGWIGKSNCSLLSVVGRVRLWLFFPLCTNPLPWSPVESRVQTHLCCLDVKQSNSYFKSCWSILFSWIPFCLRFSRMSSLKWHRNNLQQQGPLWHPPQASLYHPSNSPCVPQRHQRPPPCCLTTPHAPSFHNRGRSDHRVWISVPWGLGSQGALDCTVQSEVLLCGSIDVWLAFVDATKETSNDNKCSPRRSFLPSTFLCVIGNEASPGPCGRGFWCGNETKSYSPPCLSLE